MEPAIRNPQNTTLFPRENGCLTLRQSIQHSHRTDLHIMLRQRPRIATKACAAHNLDIVVVTSTQMCLPRCQMST